MKSKIEKLIGCARAVVNNWYEFGAEGGMDELIHHLDEAVKENLETPAEIEELKLRDRIAYGPRAPGIEILEIYGPTDYKVGGGGGGFGSGSRFDSKECEVCGGLGQAPHCRLCGLHPR